MSVKPSPLVNLMAELLAERKKDWWPDCDAEKILRLMPSFESLADQFKYATGIDTFPNKPKQGQVIYIDYGEFTYRYVYHNGEWLYVDARFRGRF